MTRILIIEDEPSIADSLCFALGREGYDATSTPLGCEGIAQARERAPDLAILDVGLPDMSGFEVCKAIRAFSDVPIIFLTARNDEIDRVVGLEIGADDYVVKPFSPRELVARVKVILKRRPAAATAAAIPTPGGLVIDRDGAAASYAGHRLELARYEFLLLALLAERPGVVHSRSQILDALWPAASGSMERTIDTHVKTLRAKLKDAGADPETIRTHRGLGYSLNAKS